MSCGCNEQYNSNCFCQCENLEVPQGPTGLQGIQGATGAVGADGAQGVNGDNAFTAELTNDAAVINRADIVSQIIDVAVRPSTTFKLREGETDLTLSLANATFTPGGAITAGDYTTSIVGGNILVVVDKWDATVRPNTYGYIDISYLHNAVTYTKRFDVVCVSDGSTFLVGETDPTAVVDPIEGNQLLDVTGALLQYQGGAWVEVLNINRTETKPVVLTGALYTLNLTSSSERIVSITGTGTVNNNIAINLPVAGCAAGTEFRAVYKASMVTGTGKLSIFGNVINVELYNSSIIVSAIYNGSVWVTVIETMKMLSSDLFSITVVIPEAVFKTLHASPYSLITVHDFPAHTSIIPVQTVTRKVFSATGAYATSGDLLLMVNNAIREDNTVIIMPEATCLDIQDHVVITPISIDTTENLDDSTWSLTTSAEFSGALETSEYKVNLLYRTINVF